MTTITATPVTHEDAYPPHWAHYRLSDAIKTDGGPVLGPLIVRDLLVAHGTDPMDGEPVTLLLAADHQGQPLTGLALRTTTGEHTDPTTAVREYLTRHAEPAW
ncbi:hypothetical protein [Nesterenkonia massiliensis]|uniref:hypothetical protein n=1 Tax=Nesterenkonia massiliensis TaxID=1232429 RepID=UPI0004270815|nr:hypothetical protein [Nesterenkonia massiliensis]